MTSYFSVQVTGIENVYTARDYWTAFAIFISISFLALFFFSRMLMWVTETLDSWVNNFSKACARYMFRRLKKKEAAAESK